MNRYEKIDQIKRQKYFVLGDVAVFAAALLLIAFFVFVAFLIPKDIGDAFYVYCRG